MPLQQVVLLWQQWEVVASWALEPLAPAVNVWSAASKSKHSSQNQAPQWPYWSTQPFLLEPVRPMPQLSLSQKQQTFCISTKAGFAPNCTKEPILAEPQNATASSIKAFIG